MSKKRAGESLTGGTGDVNPQQFIMRVVQSAPDTYTQQLFPLPIQRLNSKGKAMVMEVLRIFFFATGVPVAIAAQVIGTIRVHVTTSAFATEPGPDNPRLVMRYEKEFQNAFTAAGSFVYDSFEPFMIDMTDGAGHGFLIGTDNLFLAVSSASTSVANVATARILYRWKDVGLSEYIGIVQSQQ